MSGKTKIVSEEYKTYLYPRLNYFGEKRDVIIGENPILDKGPYLNDYYLYELEYIRTEEIKSKNGVKTNTIKNIQERIRLNDNILYSCNDNIMIWKEYNKN